MGSRVVVVGGSGFLGRHIVTALAERGYEPVVLSRHLVAGRASLVGDATTMSVDAWSQALATGTEAVVFAAGADASYIPSAPAKDYFDQGNVEPVRRMAEAARAAGCRQIVLCGSYFATMAREHPELRLTEEHPYIESRRAQADVALDSAGPGFNVAVLELPYVLGRTEGRPAALTPLAPWLRSRWPLFAPPGGTAVVTVDQVAQAVCEAIDRKATGRFPMAEANLTWIDLFTRLAQAAGRTPARVHTLSPMLLKAVLRLLALRHRIAKREAGLNPARMTALFTLHAYLDPDLCRTELGVTPGGLDQSLRDSVG